MVEEPLWRPDARRIEQANMTRFLRERGFPDYPALYRWSVEKREEFWPAVWEFCGVQASRRWDEREALVWWTEQGRQAWLSCGGLSAEPSGDGGGDAGGYQSRRGLVVVFT